MARCVPVASRAGSDASHLLPAQASTTVSEMLDVAISPDAFEPWQHSYAQLLQWALLPAPDDTLK